MCLSSCIHGSVFVWARTGTRVPHNKQSLHTHTPRETHIKPSVHESVFFTHMPIDMYRISRVCGCIFLYSTYLVCGIFSNQIEFEIFNCCCCCGCCGVFFRFVLFILFCFVSFQNVSIGNYENGNYVATHNYYYVRDTAHWIDFQIRKIQLLLFWSSPMLHVAYLSFGHLIVVYLHFMCASTAANVSALCLSSAIEMTWN